MALAELLEFLGCEWWPSVRSEMSWVTCCGAAFQNEIDDDLRSFSGNGICKYEAAEPVTKSAVVLSIVFEWVHAAVFEYPICLDLSEWLFRLPWGPFKALLAVFSFLLNLLFHSRPVVFLSGALRGLVNA